MKLEYPKEWYEKRIDLEGDTEIGAGNPRAFLTAHNINAFAAYDMLKLPENTVMISINNVDEELFELHLDRKDPRILTVVFADITKPLDLRNCRGNGKIIQPVDDKTILKMIEFIRTHKDKNFIIHCAAGISRSGATALFINKVYGHQLKERFWNLSHPNPYVLNKLLVLSGNDPFKNLIK